MLLLTWTPDAAPAGSSLIFVNPYFGENVNNWKAQSDRRKWKIGAHVSPTRETSSEKQLACATSVMLAALRRFLITSCVTRLICCSFTSFWTLPHEEKKLKSDEKWFSGSWSSYVRRWSGEFWSFEFSDSAWPKIPLRVSTARNFFIPLTCLFKFLSF